MKIASVFVTVFVAASLAQNFQWSFNGQPPIAAPTSPYVLVEGESKRQSSPLVNFQSFSPLYPDVIRSGSNYASPLTPDEEDNANLLLSPSTNPWEIQLGHEAEARNRFRHQLSNSPRFLNSAFFSFLVSTSTITVLFPVTSAVVSTCIPASQFISGSTIPCARRRRRGVEYEESYADPIMQQPLHIAPSPIQTTARSVDASMEKHDSHQPEILSSRGIEEVANPRLDSLVRKARQLRITTTSTSYIFASTIVKKTISLIAASSQLNCLPSPYIVC